MSIIDFIVDSYGIEYTKKLFKKLFKYDKPYTGKIVSIKDGETIPTIFTYPIENMPAATGVAFYVEYLDEK